ncbi:peptidase M24, structural domain-containing protein [Mycena rosella]|uniref:Peptidase M24, structural domain-containing protein n=1 Tax=Mycena rosella TaxID=1033263 RepID=A0AAD7G7N2_MYCRO|nr:peptidase M24, structural domain-containing protein [Mycena rosella]
MATVAQPAAPPPPAPAPDTPPDADAEDNDNDNDATPKKEEEEETKEEKARAERPPRIGLSKFFPDGNYPEGEIQHYKDDNAWRTTSEEKRYDEKRLAEDPETTYQNIRKGAEVHRLVRKHARKHIRPGMTMTEIVENIEAGTRALAEGDGLEAGVGFPPAAADGGCPEGGHWRAHQGTDPRLAFTLSWDPNYDNLIAAVKAATDTGIREAGIDVRLGELGGLIRRRWSRTEVEIGGKNLSSKPIENLSGHTITPYQIHGGSTGKIGPPGQDGGPDKNGGGRPTFAIETFGSTGRGPDRRKYAYQGDCSHYARIYDAPNVPLRYGTAHIAKSLLKTINKNFGTLPFCRRYLDRLGESKYLLALNHLVAQGIVCDYPPLYDQIGSKTAQFEHTILLRPTCKEVVSRGDDY